MDEEATVLIVKLRRGGSVSISKSPKCFAEITVTDCNGMKWETTLDTDEAKIISHALKRLG